ncbi:MAG: LysR family transcriptional regulator [Clostridia bacterium]|nr:LysR family transcriptional regulator [Clostridia bacterium]
MFKNKEYVLSVEKSKSFSKAAKELYISQPSLSASIKRIEKEIGAPIFDRSTNPLSLTDIGKKYIECANEISTIEDSFKNFVSDSFNVLKGEIKIGGSGMFNSFVLSELISRFNRHYPNIKFHITEDHTQNLIDRIISGKLDIVMDNVLINNKSLNPQKYSTETLLVAVPKSYAVNKAVKEKCYTANDIKECKHNAPDAKTVSLTTFKNEPFVLLKSENDTGKRALKLFKRHDIKPKILFKLDQQITAYNFTCSGVGVSFVSDTMIKNLSGSSDVLFYRLDEKDIERNIYFYTKTNRYLTKAAQSFIEESIKIANSK